MIKTRQEIIELSKCHVEATKQAARNLGRELNEAAASGHQGGYFHGYNDCQNQFTQQPQGEGKQVVTEKEIEELQELENKLTYFIGEIGNDALSDTFLLWMDKRNEINSNRIGQLEAIINEVKMPTAVLYRT